MSALSRLDRFDDVFPEMFHRYMKGERKAKGEPMVVKELYVGSASRGCSLAHDVDDKVSIARYEDGMLDLSRPKNKQASSRKMAIQ